MNNKIIKQYFENKFNQENNYKAILSKVRKEEKMGKNKIIKMCATFVLTIGVAAGLAYAGTVVYEKVFKKPEKIDNFVEELQVKDEDLKKIISKQEALEKAKEEIKRYGLELNQNPDIEILKAPNYDEISYVIKSGRLEVNINALTGKLTGFYQNSDNKEKQLEKYHSTKEKIVEVAKEKMKEYGLGSEYEICYISNNNSDDEKKAYLWYIWFAKKYDGLFNEGQSVSITLIPQINFVESLNIKDEQFENNPIVISESEAIQIAKQKDEQINNENYEIKEVKSKLAIRQINAEVYLKENGIETRNEQKVLEDGTIISYDPYKRNGKWRKVYVVEIIYLNRPFGQTRKYYIDSTTKEVVGGEDIYDLLKLGEPVSTEG